MNPTIASEETIDDILRIQRRALLNAFQSYNCDPFSFAVWLDLYIRKVPGASIALIAKQLEVERTTVYKWRTGARVPNKLTVRHVVSVLTLAGRNTP